MDSDRQDICDCTGSDKCDHIAVCGKPMEIKMGSFGRFRACTGFPDCRMTKPILKSIGVPCPKPKCEGDIVERRGRGRGRSFFNCSTYPNCDLILNQRPLTNPCPKCGGLIVQKNSNYVACIVCNWQEPSEPSIDTAYLDSPVCPQCGDVFTRQGGSIYAGCATCGYLTGGG
jgi:ssDNA-binding Zn-finger/Zn-ribbon topoisomerase 1